MTHPDIVHSLAEIEAALMVAAFVVVRHGSTYAPIMHRLRAERDEALRRNIDPVDEARTLLATLHPVARLAAPMVHS